MWLHGAFPAEQVYYMLFFFYMLYFVGPPTDIQLTMSNLVTTSKLILLTQSLTPNHNLIVY